MGLLQPATVEQAAAKVGLFGRQGSGKTTTASLLAIGVSKTYHNGAPVAFFDTENGSDYLVPIFEAEGIPLLTVKSRAFRDMRGALHEATEAGCCAYLVDSYTAAWTDLTDSFKAKSKRKKLEFHHMDALKGIWREWVTDFLNSNLHVFLAGRLGYEWDREADSDDGEKGDLIKVGTKLKGEAEAGYEPSLLIELEALQTEAGRLKKTRAKKSTITHNAYVLKDRWRTLNGRVFTFPDLNGYKVGDWKKVFTAFEPHFAKLAIGQPQRAINAHRTSADLFTGDMSDFGRKKDIALEEIRESIAAVFGGRSDAEKRARQVVLETLFNTLSWSKVESLRLETLEAAVPVLVEFRSRAQADRDELTSEAGIASLLQLCQDVVRERAAIDTTADDVEDVPV